MHLCCKMVNTGGKHILFTLFSNGGLGQCQLSLWCPYTRIVQHQPAFFTVNVCLPPYSPFLNPIEECFSMWRWNVYDLNPYTRVNIVQAMELACGDMGVKCFQGWIKHTRGFFTYFFSSLLTVLSCDGYYNIIKSNVQYLYSQRASHMPIELPLSQPQPSRKTRKCNGWRKRGAEHKLNIAIHQESFNGC